MNISNQAFQTDFLSNPNGLRPIDQARLYMESAIDEFQRRAARPLETTGFSFQRNLNGVLTQFRDSSHPPEIAFVPRITQAVITAAELWQGADAASTSALVDAAQGAIAIFAPIIADLPPVRSNR